jgi:riboflavin kinase / FMN adenylyltransferase
MTDFLFKGYIMKIVRGIHNWKKINKPVIAAMGVFDGVHKGHQAVIKQAINLAKKNKGKSFVITFDMHPRTLLYPDKKIEILTSEEEKIKILKDLGLDGIIVLYFNENMANMSAQDFFQKELIEKIGIKGLVIGQNFKFGNKQEGDINFLKRIGIKYNCKVKAVKSLIYNKKTISSTNIRKFLHEGNLKYVTTCLSRDYSVEGKIVRGLSLGHKHGVPTVNIHIPFGKLLPIGVFGGYIEISGKKYKAIINSGYRPTIDLKENKLCLEAHILNFNKNVYGRNAKLYFAKKIRDEKKFRSIKDLFEQIKKDIKSFSYPPVERN